MSQQHDYKVNFWLGVGAIVGILMVLLLFILKKQGLDTWAGFLFGAFGGMLSMVIFLPAWVDRYRAWKASAVKAATDDGGKRPGGRDSMQEIRDFLTSRRDIFLTSVVPVALGAAMLFTWGHPNKSTYFPIACLTTIVYFWASVRHMAEYYAEVNTSLRRSATEAEGLRQQLKEEQENSASDLVAREAIELELMELRQQRGTEALADIKEMLHDDIEYRALLNRAEKAERMVESLNSQAREQAEKIKRDSIPIKKLAERLESTPAAEQPETNSDTSLAFPYATKQLEAMRDAAAVFWQAHDRSKPAPHGIQKQVQLFLSGRIGSNERKATELANAIKPDDLPEK